MSVAADFLPPLWLRSGMVQTFLASSTRRQKLGQAFEADATRLDLPAGDGMRTSCYLNERADAKGLVILFHGWLGTPQSGYVVSAARRLYNAGFSIARMTLPDHGDAALMNAGIIDITRHDFLREAVRNLVAERRDLPVGIMGFSLGGNFALRLARDLNDHPIRNLRHIIGISPVIEPADTCDMIDAYAFFRHYFLRKFTKLARAKQALYPHLDTIDEVLAHRTIRGLTEVSVRRWTPFPDIDSYFAGYRIRPGDFTDCPARVTRLSAQDDPIVRAIHAQSLPEDPGLERIFTRHGGHNGFFSVFPHVAFSEDVAVNRFLASLLG
jgi:predicted alpha/beta-fold hydrolase